MTQPNTVVEVTPGVKMLTTRKNVHVFFNLPKKAGSRRVASMAPNEIAFVMAGVRCFSIRTVEDCGGRAYSAAYHNGLGVWYPLCQKGSYDAAFYAVAAFLDRVAKVPQHYSPENEQAALDAAAATLVQFS